MMKQALKCGMLFCPQNGKTLKNAVILVDGNKILAIQGEHEAIPDGFGVIDLSDRFVMPGLIDAHVHTGMSGEASELAASVIRTVGDVAFTALHNAQLDLNAGFTTLRDAGSTGFADVALRNAINRGDVVGPRMLVSGESMGSTGGHADSHFAPHIQSTLLPDLCINGVESARRAARYNLKYGADFLKFMATGGVMSLGTTVGSQQLTFDEMAAIIEIAEMYGVHTATHAHGTNGIKAAVRAGVTSVEHGMMLDDEAIDLMLQKGTYLTPTIIAAERIVVNGEAGGIAGWMVQKARQVLENHKNGIQKCLARGVKLDFGSDAGTPYNFHGKQGYEFELMVSFGFTPAQALTAATVTNSHLLRMQDKIGTIEPGKLADIVAFAGNPLDDIKVMQDCRFVMKDGAVIKS